MYELGLLGNEIGYSLSPLIHNYWLSLYKIAGTYNLIDTPLEQFEARWRELLKGHLRGFNITIPYKELAYKKISNISSRLTAINTVYKTVSGEWSFANTDVEGGMSLFQPYAHTDKVVIIGNGGTARAVVEIFHQLQAKKIHLIQRRAKEWHPAYKLSFHDLSQGEEILCDTPILINTIPHQIFSLETLSPQTLVCDYTYHQKDNRWLAQATAKGCSTISGIEFLLKQAQYSFNYWFGIFPDITESLKQKLLC